MNKDITHYRRVLKHHLACGTAVRKRLLSQFDNSLHSFLEDCPAPTYAQLETAFGPPEEMANILMENVPEKDQTIYKIRKNVCRILAVAVAALFIAFSIYVFYFKEITVITSYDTAFPNNVASTQNGN